uniref:RING-type domain-containing protein n=1 Tax=Kryptolebias marmoratus TaxID=37003 RepID=A0A3Q3AUF2_KRYMA
MRNLTTSTEEALFCPICSDVYRNPVILSCDHNFCHDCLWTFWKDGQTSACPLCKRRSSKTIPPFDFTLKTECDAVLLARASAAESELTCSTHSEKLGFFCLDDRQLVCGVCTDSGAHAEHQVRLVDEAGQELRAQLHDSLQSLKKKLRLLRRVKGSCDETAAHVKVQAGSALRRIQEEFRRLHRFLDEEEEARLVSLREEEEQKSRLMKEKIAALSRDISALSDIIKTTEEQLKAHNALFLQGYKETAERVRQPPADDPELASGTLIDVYSLYLILKLVKSQTTLINSCSCLFYFLFSWESQINTSL